MEQNKNGAIEILEEIDNDYGPDVINQVMRSVEQGDIPCLRLEPQI